MIPVTRQPAPDDFNEKVRDPGIAWLNAHSIALDQPPPDPSKLPSYWRKVQKDLWEKYSGICAYLCIYFHWPVGAQSTDHFIAKSSNAGMAYAWENYRLSCLAMNRNKNQFEDVLDPFEIQPDMFILNLVSGEIKPNSTMTRQKKTQVLKTIKRLRLNSPECKTMRAEHYGDYLVGNVSESFLRRKSPFVWYEANRQGLL